MRHKATIVRDAIIYEAGYGFKCNLVVRFVFLLENAINQAVALSLCLLLFCSYVPA